jgi:hypothetical protein
MEPHLLSIPLEIWAYITSHLPLSALQQLLTSNRDISHYLSNDFIWTRKMEEEGIDWNSLLKDFCMSQ